jgi:opacity protein-like surface antigen
MNNKTILILIFITFSVLKAEAQVSIGLFSGYLIPIGDNAEDVYLNGTVKQADYRTFSKGNIPLGISLKYQFKNNVMLSLEYANAININEGNLVSYGGSTYKSTFYNKLSNYNFGVNYLFSKFYYKKLNVLIGINIGLYTANLSMLYENNEKNKSTVTTLVHQSTNELGLGNKLGLNYQLTDQISIDALFRYNYIFTSNDEEGMINRNNVVLKNSHLIGTELGINFKF